MSKVTHEATADTTSKILAEGDHILGILPHHLKEFRASGLSDETIKANGLHSETQASVLAGLLDWERPRTRQVPAIIYPYAHGPDGDTGYTRVKPDTPRTIKGDTVKYESPLGRPNQPYFPAGVAALLDDATAELLITEGEKKALKATQEGFPCIGLVGVFGWKTKKHEKLLPALERVKWQGRKVCIAFDSDLGLKFSVQDAESRLAAALKAAGADVRCLRIPDGPAAGEPPLPTKQGLDDFLVAQGADCKQALRKLIDEAVESTPVEGGGEYQKGAAKDLDPATTGKLFLKETFVDDMPAMRFWQGGFIWWNRGRYVDVKPSEVRAKLVEYINQTWAYLKTSHTNDVMDQVKAQSLLSFGYQPPCWIGEPPVPWKPEDCIAAKNGIINLPALFKGEDSTLPATPRFFTPAALDFDFASDAPPPIHWLAFLKQLWPDDPGSIELLQEWFGYCLTPDTRQQKMLLLIGPPRAGKGVIARVIRSVVGEANVAGPTLASFAEHFGLQPLLGKTLAIVSDARLSGRTDQAVVVERLLSISGEDAQTVHRKHMEAITTKLLARVMILSNELPRLNENSGALSNRFLMLSLNESFLGREDETLTDRLLEERGSILLWALAGWKRLRDRRHFQQPESGKELRGQLDDLASPVGAFVRECCIIGNEAVGKSIPVATLYAAWRRWCESKGRGEPGPEQTFGRDLSAAVPSIRRIRPRDGEDRIRAYENIAVRTINGQMVI